MSAGWLLYAVAVSALLAAAATLLESALRLGRLPTRGVWLAALVATLGLLASAPYRASAPSADGTEAAGDVMISGTAAPAVDAGAGARPFAEISDMLAGALAQADHFLEPLESAPLRRAAMLGWGVATAVLLLAFVGALLRGARLRSGWPRRELQGASVRVAPGVGPLVAGVIHPEIVVPEWMMTAPETEQRLVLAHETEHIRGGDPALLVAGCLVVAFLPWNPAAWWMLRRLRLAVELDCDARVLRGGAERCEYGSVLVDIATRRSGGLLWAPALLEGPSQLERRLTLMTRRIPRYAPARGLALGVLSALFLLGACEASMPTASKIEEMDVTAAETGARRVGFPLLANGKASYMVDGEAVSAEEARAIPSSFIATIDLRSVGAPGEETREIRIHTLRALGSEEVLDAADESPAESVRILTPLRSGDRAPGADERLWVPSRSKDTATNLDHFAGILLIDGKRVDPAVLGTMKPDRIESIEIVKGSAAAGLFDAPEARNGVIRVTTKRPGS